MNVGDYVRTKDGLITKFEREDDIFYVFDKMISTDKDINRYVNISPNIIDLIEVGDYVNGNRVDFTNNNNKLSYENKCIGFYDGDGDITLFEKDIKTIVTREMFESMEYKVGE